jgi:Smg protein
MFDILFYVFENCQQAELSQDTDGVAKKLSAAGFDDTDISEALRWLDGVVNVTHRMLAPLPSANPALRAYAARELNKLDAACRGFLLYLEQAQVLSAQAREIVLERALAAAGGPLSLEQLKLIVLMVLWNQHTPASRLIAEDLISGISGRLPS